MSELLGRVPQERLLRRAYQHMRKQWQHQGAPLWTLVSEVTPRNSAASRALCHELGWNPDMRIGADLPE